MENIVIKTSGREIRIPAGRPVLIRWKGKNKQRPGVNTAVGWIKPATGNSHAVELVHRAFSTWDKVENEYTCTWTIWHTQIIDVKLMAVQK